jgi:UDP-glucuronate 4-epimerase
MNEERFLVTGAGGCIGAWVIAQLVGEGTPAVALDASDDDHRLRLLLDDAALAALPRVRGDITDLDAFERTLDEHGITRVIHLAALQVPFCRADPPLGARVNVVGTVNVFEAIARRADRMGPVVYASSVAAYDALEEGETAAAMQGVPSTLYGVFKRANEGTASVYAADRAVASVGLRPHTVYGPGRDQGLTSAPTTAMVAAAAGVRFHIPFGGSVQMQYTPDVGEAFARAAELAYRGASVHNLDGPVVSMPELLELIARSVPGAERLLTAASEPLPFPAEVDHTSWLELVGEPVMRPVEAGVADGLERFRALLADGRVRPPSTGGRAAG